MNRVQENSINVFLKILQENTQENDMFIVIDKYGFDISSLLKDYDNFKEVLLNGEKAVKTNAKGIEIILQNLDPDTIVVYEDDPTNTTGKYKSKDLDRIYDIYSLVWERDD